MLKLCPRMALADVICRYRRGGLLDPWQTSLLAERRSNVGKFRSTNQALSPCGSATRPNFPSSGNTSVLWELCGRLLSGVFFNRGSEHEESYYCWFCDPCCFDLRRYGQKGIETEGTCRGSHGLYHGRSKPTHVQPGQCCRPRALYEKSTRVRREDEVEGRSAQAWSM